MSGRGSLAQSLSFPAHSNPLCDAFAFCPCLLWSMSCSDPELARPRSQRSEDEKTVRDEQFDQAYATKKDGEDGVCSEGDGQTREQAVDSTTDDDGFPEGGLKAWSVVFGVSVQSVIAPLALI